VRKCFVVGAGLGDTLVSLPAVTVATLRGDKASLLAKRIDVQELTSVALELPLEDVLHIEDFGPKDADEVVDRWGQIEWNSGLGPVLPARVARIYGEVLSGYALRTALLKYPDKDFKRRGLDPKRYVVFSPWSRVESSGRCLTYEEVEQVVNAINSEGFTCVVVDTKPRVVPGHVVNLTGETSLSDLCSLITRAAAVVSVDTGTLHLAAAYHIPTLVIFRYSISPNALSRVYWPIVWYEKPEKGIGNKFFNVLHKLLIASQLDAKQILVVVPDKLVNGVTDEGHKIARAAGWDIATLSELHPERLSNAACLWCEYSPEDYAEWRGMLHVIDTVPHIWSMHMVNGAWDLLTNDNKGLVVLRGAAGLESASSNDQKAILSRNRHTIPFQAYDANGKLSSDGEKLVVGWYGTASVHRQISLLYDACCKSGIVDKMVVVGVVNGSTDSFYVMKDMKSLKGSIPLEVYSKETRDIDGAISVFAEHGVNCIVRCDANSSMYYPDYSAIELLGTRLPLIVNDACGAYRDIIPFCVSFDGSVDGLINAFHFVLENKELAGYRAAVGAAMCDPQRVAREAFAAAQEAVLASLFMEADTK